MSSPDDIDVVVYVRPSSLREVFNRSQIPGAINRGELIAHFLGDGHLQRPELVGEKYCTRGQMIRYLDSANKWVVEVFQYLREGGSLGASGLPDPNRMRIGGEIWVASGSPPGLDSSS